MSIPRYFNLIKNNYITKKSPISLVHFVTNRCNARCSFCFIDFDNPNTFKGELSVDEIRKLSLTLGNSIQNINLTGGEPFARKEIEEISEIYIKNSKVQSLFITSNGSLPDRIESYLNNLTKKFPDNKFVFSFSIDNIGSKHDTIRKIDGLFEKCINSYKLVHKFGNNVFGNISITVSLENYSEIMDIYNQLVNKYKVKAVTAVIVRDEGIYKTPIADKKNILNAYKNLTNKIKEDKFNGILGGYNSKTLQGRLQNTKNSLMYENIVSTYLEPKFISHCYAGSTFGVINADGSVYPCEILEKPLGSLRDYDLNFMKLWEDKVAKDTKKWIKDTKCNCTYECAWSFNILGNVKYQKDLILAAIGKEK
jgi:radical SAM protein with 4Fe4S-binding SPASM domain